MLQVHDQHRHGYALLEYLFGIAGCRNTNEERAHYSNMDGVCIRKLLTELSCYFYLIGLLMHKADQVC